MGLKGVTHYYSALTGQEKINSIFKILSILAAKPEKLQVIIFFNEIRQLENFYRLLQNEKNLFVVNDPQASIKNKNNLAIDYVHGKCGVCKGNH